MIKLMKWNRKEVKVVASRHYVFSIIRECLMACDMSFISKFRFFFFFFLYLFLNGRSSNAEDVYQAPPEKLQFTF
jgi:hypothetical protein